MMTYFKIRDFFIRINIVLDLTSIGFYKLLLQKNQTKIFNQKRFHKKLDQLVQ